MTALQKTIVTATIAVLAGAGIYEARQVSQLRDQVQTLQQEQAPVTGQIQQLQSERDDATNRLALLADEIERLKNNSGELLKLRGEVGMLKAENNKLRDSATNQSPSNVATRWTPQQLTNAGFATPLQGLQTILWAASTGNAEVVNTNIVTSLADFGLRSLSDNLRLIKVVGAESPEFKVLAERKISDTSVQIDVEQKVGPYRFLKSFNMGLYRDGWKVEVSESPQGLNTHLDF